MIVAVCLSIPDDVKSKRVTLRPSRNLSELCGQELLTPKIAEDTQSSQSDRSSNPGGDKVLVTTQIPVELRDPPHPFILLAYAQHVGRMRTQFLRRPR
jgi:hypothetical protein